MAGASIGVGFHAAAASGYPPHMAHLYQQQHQNQQNPPPHQQRDFHPPMPGVSGLANISSAHLNPPPSSSVGGYAGRKEKGYALTSKVTRQVGDVRRRVIATLDHVEELRFR